MFFHISFKQQCLAQKIGVDHAAWKHIWEGLLAAFHDTSCNASGFNIADHKHVVRAKSESSLRMCS